MTSDTRAIDRAAEAEIREITAKLKDQKQRALEIGAFEFARGISEQIDVAERCLAAVERER